MSSNKRKEATALPSAFHERPLTAAKGESWCDFLGKGKLYKGTPFDYKKYNFYEKQRISELQVGRSVMKNRLSWRRTRRSFCTRI